MVAEDLCNGENWLVKWLRKHPCTIPDPVLLTPEGESVSPVLEKLGGAAWFEDRKHTDRAALEMRRMCVGCGASESVKRLLGCAKCKRVYYW